MSASTPLPADHPLMEAWTRYAATADYANTLRWATAQTDLRFVEGSLWAAFMAGWSAHGGGTTAYEPAPLSSPNDTPTPSVIERLRDEPVVGPSPYINWKSQSYKYTPPPGTVVAGQTISIRAEGERVSVFIDGELVPDAVVELQPSEASTTEETGAEGLRPVGEFFAELRAAQPPLISEAGMETLAAINRDAARIAAENDAACQRLGSAAQPAGEAAEILKAEILKGLQVARQHLAGASRRRIESFEAVGRAIAFIEAHAGPAREDAP